MQLRHDATAFLRLDADFFAAMFRAMTITPADIRDRAYKARVSINKLMDRAGLPNSTFWRWDTGRTNKLHPITLARIIDALEAFEAERNAA